MRTSSKHLAIISITILVVAITNGALILTAINRLHNDAKIINYSGIVRGMIQRTVKLESNHIPSEELIQEISGLIDGFVGMGKNMSLKGAEKEFVAAFAALENHWSDLVVLIREYRRNPSEYLRSGLLEKSETCWNLANDIVFAAQSVSERKLNYFWIVFLLIMVNLASIVSIIWLIKSYVKGRLEYSAFYDPLTGIYNRCTYNFAIVNEISAAQRYGHSLSVLLIDIDFFKKVNDAYGHQRGDAVLSSVAGIVLENIRTSDSLFRIGGEEFAVIAKHAHLENARKLGEKIRQAIENSPFYQVGKISVSIGVTQMGENDSVDRLFSRADKALYKAKDQGRNRVQCEEAEQYPKKINYVRKQKGKEFIRTFSKKFTSKKESQQDFSCTALPIKKHHISTHKN